MAIEQLDGSADLAAAHDALEGHRWQEAFDLLTRADRDGGLARQTSRRLRRRPGSPPSPISQSKQGNARSRHTS